jgi:hypothetical protein
VPYRALTSALILVLLTTCEGQQTAGVSPEEGVPLLMATLGRAKVSGSLEYSGQCNIPDFPKLHAPLRFIARPLQFLREVFSEDPKMVITQEPDRTIRMIETGVPRDLLNVRISHISFGRGPAQSAPLYDPTVAMWAILGTAEVKEFKAAHNIGSPSEAVNLPHAPFTRESPHIMGGLDNVTLSQALDHLLQVFPGLWIYENCPGTESSKRMVLFSYFADGPAWLALEIGP